ncbi:response regulator [Hyella patelloides]|uniref:response regulator n=1 Tax=Hyella patelloides TaxID=1982969 RepID=UPI0024826488|nr:response regulator [Hyella patelloides]
MDDSPVVQAMLKRSLSDRYEVILANNGMDALKILNSNKKNIELILLDVTMPDIDGIELCRTIRRFKKFQTLPIIMLTAKDGMFDKVKGKFAGSTEYLTKPVDKEELLTIIGKYVPSMVTTK